jgi:PPOX class probable F420-dependent enzyme
MMPDGQPQMSIVWLDFDGEHVLINTTLERQKGMNMMANPKVNVLVIDPSNGTRFLEARGEAVKFTPKGAVSHADKLAQTYSNNTKQRFYGDIYPEEQQFRETRVIFKISPQKITTDVIFS